MALALNKLECWYTIEQRNQTKPENIVSSDKNNDNNSKILYKEIILILFFKNLNINVISIFAVRIH